MTPVAEHAISVLHRARLTLGPGLTDDQISEIEGKYAFRFNPDHRAEHTLVPITGHRYIPTAPEPSGAPVLSVYQTDVIYYGADLADYCAYEYLGESTGATPGPVPFWSDVVDGAGAVHFW